MSLRTPCIPSAVSRLIVCEANLSDSADECACLEEGLFDCSDHHYGVLGSLSLLYTCFQLFYSDEVTGGIRGSFRFHNSTLQCLRDELAEFRLFR